MSEAAKNWSFGHHLRQPTHHNDLVYAGIDGCREGWVAFVLPEERVVERCRTFGEVLEAIGDVEVAGVDMPLWVPENGQREAELQVREALGPHRSSLFITPTRAALAAATQAQASVINRQRAGVGVSAQSFSLRAKIAEVAATVTGTALVEVHPELTFHLLGPVVMRKRSWAGIRERVAVLEAQGLRPWQWQCGNWAAADDTLDAAAAALSARRYALGQAAIFGASGDDLPIVA